jgi:hypothetical protein
MKVHAYRAQQGQALVESVLVCAALVLAFIGSGWLYRAHSTALSAQNAAAHGAFLATRQQADSWALRSDEGSLRVLDYNLEPFFRGLASASKSAGIQIAQHGNYLIPHRQQAEQALARYTLADQWGTDNRQVYTSSVALALSAPWALPPRSNTYEQSFPEQEMAVAYGSSTIRLERFTSIISNAGHASSDAQVQQRLAHSEQGWSSAANNSYALSERIHHAVAASDAAWKRPLATTEWLAGWAGEVPRHLLHRNTQKGLP